MKITNHYFEHSYHSSGFGLDATSKHDCLAQGFWCWKNALENPLMIIQFLKTKL